MVASPIDIVDEVSKGTFDDLLDDLIQVAMFRRTTLREINARKLVRSLKVGDTVRIIPGIKPKYMVGIIGTVCDPPPNAVDRRKHNFVWVDFGIPTRRFGRFIYVPATCLKLLSRPGEKKVRA